MKNFFRDQQILAIIIGGVAATIITAWIMNPQSGPAGWIKGLSPATQSALSGIAIILVIASVGLLVSLLAASYARTGALQPAGPDCGFMIQAVMMVAATPPMMMARICWSLKKFFIAIAPRPAMSL